MFQAPVHFLVIPRKPIAMLDEVGGTFINIKLLINVPPFSKCQCFRNWIFFCAYPNPNKISHLASGSRADIRFKICYKIKIKAPFALPASSVVDPDSGSGAFFTSVKNLKITIFLNLWLQSVTKKCPDYQLDQLIRNSDPDPGRSKWCPKGEK